MHDLVLDLDDKIHRPSRQLLTMLHCLAHALCVHYLAAIEIEHLALRTRRCHTLSGPEQASGRGKDKVEVTVHHARNETR